MACSYLESLHDLIIVWLIVITLVVILVGASRVTNVLTLTYDDSETLEKTWTIIPILILVTIGIPRIRLLCSLDIMYYEPTSTVKVRRNQWNWQRETFAAEEVDHLLDSDRLDNVGSYETPITIIRRTSRIIVARTDVLHSLGIPGIGLKLDSIPGRLNSVVTDAIVIGVFPGSCYELCGRGHRVIPITLVVL